MSLKFDFQNCEIVQATLNDADQVTDLEVRSYPSDEAADLEKMKLRIKEAGQFFLVLRYKDSKKIISFVCGTLTRLDELTEESMSEHHPDGKVLCIHSVVCDPNLRRKGIASYLLKNYVKKFQKEELKRMVLICKQYLINFYKSVGFFLIGESSVTHGKEQWYDMKIDINQ